MRFVAHRRRSGLLSSEQGQKGRLSAGRADGWPGRVRACLPVIRPRDGILGAMRRVVFVSKPVVPPFHDGTKCLVRDVALRLDRYQPVLMSTRARPSPGDSPPGFVRPELRAVYSDAGSFSPAFAENARAAAWLFAGARADLAHFVFAPNPRTSGVGRVFRALGRVPVVQTIASAPRVFEPSLFFGDIVVAQSEWTREHVVSCFRQAGRAAPRIEVVPPPVGELVPPSEERIGAVRRALDLAPDARVIVYPGDLETSSGAERVAAIVSEVAREVEGVVFVFACRHKTPRAGEVEAAHRRRLAGHPVRFVAEVDLLSLYRVATAVLFPVDDLYGKVDLPISLLEAMRLGVPVVVTSEGPLRGLAGAIQVPPGDASALALQAVALCRDAGLRASAATEGRAAVERFHDARVIARAYEALYDTLPA